MWKITSRDWKCLEAADAPNTDRIRNTLPKIACRTYNPATRTLPAAARSTLSTERGRSTRWWNFGGALDTHHFLHVGRHSSRRLERDSHRCPFWPSAFAFGDTGDCPSQPTGQT